MVPIFAMLLGLTPAAQAQVDVRITADNAYAFGWGDVSNTASWFGGVENTTAADIFNCATGPETYSLPSGTLQVGDYLYIASWHDRSVWQGVLADVTAVGFPPVLSGVGPWEVCPSGLYIDSDAGTGGPSQATVDQVIQRCNAGTELGHVTGQRWVDAVGDVNGKLAIGEDNQGGASPEYGTNQYPAVCAIDPAASWMWMDWDPSWFGPSESPFRWSDSPTDTDPSFFLFRLPVDAIPGSTSCAAVERIEAECAAEGTYDVSFLLTNHAGVDVDGLHIPHGQVSPNVVPLTLPAGGTALVDLSVAGVPGEEVCFEVLLDADKEGDDGEQPCCVETVCVKLPECDCFEVDLRAACFPGAPAGTFSVWSNLTNTSGTTMEDLFVTPVTVPGTITPGWTALGGLADGTSTTIGPFLVDGADPTQPYCFEIAAHDESFETCCEETFCVKPPPPCAEPGPDEPAPLPSGGCDQGGGATIAGFGLLLLALRRRDD